MPTHMRRARWRVVWDRRVSFFFFIFGWKISFFLCVHECYFILFYIFRFFVVALSGSVLWCDDAFFYVHLHAYVENTQEYFIIYLFYYYIGHHPYHFPVIIMCIIRSHRIKKCNSTNRIWLCVTYTYSKKLAKNYTTLCLW